MSDIGSCFKSGMLQMAGSARFTLRLEPELKEWLEKEGRRNDRSAAYVAAQAIAAHKARSEERIRAIKDAMAEADKGVFISQGIMEAWFLSLGTDHELPEPEPDIFPKKT
jgi:predicted transcriptional regulator